jgi:hypothetical protein
MLHVALLAAVLTTAQQPSTIAQSSIERCLETMDGSVYRGDPTDRTAMRANIAVCEEAQGAVQQIRISPAQGPERLFITARLLDRAATLSYMGLGNAQAAFHDARLANLYFRIAVGLPRQSPDFHAAAIANLELTDLQLQTLRTDIAAAKGPRPITVAQRSKN